MQNKIKQALVKCTAWGSPLAITTMKQEGLLKKCLLLSNCRYLVKLYCTAQWGAPHAAMWRNIPSNSPQATANSYKWESQLGQGALYFYFRQNQWNNSAAMWCNIPGNSPYHYYEWEAQLGQEALCFCFRQNQWNVLLLLLFLILGSMYYW